MKNHIERVKSSLEIDEDIDLHIKGWILQRIGWALMLVFLILAGLGFFGDGAMSEERIVDGETTLIYESYTRRDSNTELEIIAPAANGMVRVSLSPDFNKSFRIERMSPEPADQSIVNGNTLMDFPCTGQGQITLFLSVRKKEIGRVESPIVVNNSEFTLNSYIYP